mmetsp:Transcript_29162/g.46521  ORF Transcript_29162/g.46521 Transcript_29162/m.46521 type:complete len:111 (-) Transcript_29162:529-861(-)
MLHAPHATDFKPHIRHEIQDIIPPKSNTLDAILESSEENTCVYIEQVIELSVYVSKSDTERGIVVVIMNHDDIREEKLPTRPKEFREHHTSKYGRGDYAMHTLKEDYDIG